MKKITIAENSGFCFGVKRAINLALQAGEKNEIVYTIGPIIHNSQMVEYLKTKGIKPIEITDEYKGKVPIIIRSHGIEKDKFEILKKSGIKIYNAICPYVAKAQQYAIDLQKEGYKIVILGNINHPEVVALNSYLDGEAIIVDNKNELPEKLDDKIGVICQTTQKLENLQDLVREIVATSKELRVINTICKATYVRQKSTMAIARNCDLMIVIGGKNSSNTIKLKEISQKFTLTHHIETWKELDYSWFTGKQQIGITAGASTPFEEIKKIYNKIANHMQLPEI